MALYGRNKDALLIQGLNKELLHNIIEQQVGYYKPVLENTPANIYGEAQNKTWLGPLLLKWFLRKDLVEANIIPEIGDAILWNEDYYEVDNLVENQLLVGKDPLYPYSDTVDDFGASLSIIVTCHYTRPERLGIKEQRI